MAQIIIKITAGEGENGGTEVDTEIRALGTSEEVIAGEIAKRIATVYASNIDTAVSCALKSIRKDIENSK